MKILFLAFRYPLPETGGDYLRINAIARYLRQQGHEVILLSLFHPRESQKIYDTTLYNRSYLLRRFNFFSYVYTILAFLFGYPMQVGYFFSWRYLLKLKHIIQSEKPDCIIPHSLRMTEYLFLLHHQKNVIVEQTDALSKTYSQCVERFSWERFNLKLFLYSIEQKRIAKYEQKMISYFPKIVYVSNDDISFLGNAPNLFCYSNGVQVYPERVQPDMNKIVFIGNMRSLQNEDAALFFASEIFPLIKKQMPQALFYVAGANPSQNILKLQEKDSNIKVTGFLEDLDGFVANAALAVAPVRYAAGIQNKVLVALAHHIPVVLTPLIAKGIPELKDNENCFIRLEPAEFAEACLQCLQRTATIIQLENNGYEIVKEKYGWNSRLKGYLE